MANKEQKKKKLKLLKENQKENRKRNKEKNEMEVLEEKKLTSLSDLNKFNGIREYVLLSLSEILEKIEMKNYDDSSIVSTAEELTELALNPEDTYSKFLNSENSIVVNKFRGLLNDGNNKINNTERYVLKFEMLAIINEFSAMNVNPSIDYGAIKICFQTAYKLLYTGMENKKIKRLDVYIAYNDIVNKVKVTYSNSNKHYDLSDKYNLKTENFLLPIYHPLDELYNQDCIYKTILPNFDEDSIRLLGMAYEREQLYKNREEGREMFSYNSFAFEYVTVLERELKKLISFKFNLDTKKIRLIDAINKLKDIDNKALSSEKTISTLNKLRELRNKVAHASSIDENDFKYIHTKLIKEKILEIISWELNGYKVGDKKINNSKDPSKRKVIYSSNGITIEAFDYDIGNSLADGERTIESENGLKYHGQIKDGEANGKGVLIHPNGERYEGEFRDGEIQGMGKLIYPNGDIYEGEFRKSGISGKGIMTIHNGDIYEGQFKDGKKHGKGIYTFSNGNMYKGDFKRDKINGSGVLVYSNGTRLEGQWKDGSLNGRGVASYSYGDKYIGQFKDGLKHGRGKLISLDGTKYEGEFINGNATGMGEYTSPVGGDLIRINK